MQEYIEFARNNALIVIGFFAVLGFIIKTEISNATRKYKQVGVNEAVMLMNKDDALVLDVRNSDIDKMIGIINKGVHIDSVGHFFLGFELYESNS